MERSIHTQRRQRNQAFSDGPQTRGHSLNVNELYHGSIGVSKPGSQGGVGPIQTR